MSRRKGKTSEIGDVLFRIKRGLAGYVSYLAACEMNQAFSEYVLYEPMLRILTALGYDVECEVACPGLPKDGGPGDFKRIDFVANRNGIRFAIEVKWAKTHTINVKSDHAKLQAYHQCTDRSSSFLCVFGKKATSKISNLRTVVFPKEARPSTPIFGGPNTAVVFSN